MMHRLDFMWPEIIMFVATCITMVMGLSRTLSVRKATAWVAAAGLAVAGIVAIKTTPAVADMTPEAGQLLLPGMVVYAKVLIAVVGLMLLMMMAGTVDRREESAIASGKSLFDPLRSNRAEFYSFFLFSLTGLMLCASADDLIWLFLALELTSLPTYIMVTISSARNRAREAGVKYFFLGALGAAVFLYGFAMLYGGTGTTNLNQIAQVFQTSGINTIALAGLLLALLGLAFKIAAVPMHFYTPDVYEGAAPQVSGFLAFVPKTAGFIGILLICAAAGWVYPRGAAGVSIFGESRVLTPVIGGAHLPELVHMMLWVMAALTMTVGNVLAVLQSSVKRMLAYSSVAHSGYMLVGVIAGPGNGTFTESGIAAVLFYLMAYGVMNAGVFAVLSAVERSPGPDGEPREVETINDLRGLARTHPALGISMVICSLSLLGLPPLLGFFGKLPLFTAGIRAGEVPLVVILGINSAIAAFYYLKLAFVPLLEVPDEHAEPVLRAPFSARGISAVVSAGGVVLLAIFGNGLMEQAVLASKFGASPRPAAVVEPITPENPPLQPAGVNPEPVADAAGR